MCLAVPGKIIERGEGDALVDFRGNRLRVITLLTPDAVADDWVLVHAGFAIAKIEEKDALETWDYLRAAVEGPVEPAGGARQPGEDKDASR